MRKLQPNSATTWSLVGMGVGMVCGNVACVLCRFTRFPSSSLFFERGSPTKIDYRKKGTLILTSLLEDLVHFG